MLKKFLMSMSILMPIVLAAGGSSTSDNDHYPVFCFAAVNNAEIFAQFRRAPVYRSIVETVSEYQGQAYLQVIKQQAPDLLAHIWDFKKSDLYGNPIVFHYPDVGAVAPTTLRYIKVLSDLKILFGSLDQFSIIEIGGGYGGQCKIIADLFNVKKYVIVDLPGPLALAEKFLDAQGIKNVTFLTPDQVQPGAAYDLVLSNYAYSELVDPVRQKYLREVLVYAQRGYMICNDATGTPDCGHLMAGKEKLLQELTQYKIFLKLLPEYPLTDLNNYLVAWGLQ